MTAWNYFLGAAEAMLGMRYSWRDKVLQRTEEDIKADIDRQRVESDREVDMHILERKLYLLESAILNTRSEIPLIKRHLESMSRMGKKTKNSPEFELNRIFLKNRLTEYEEQLEEDTAEYENSKEILKAYNFSKIREKFEKEIEELKQLEADELAWKAKATEVEGPPESPTLEK